MQKANPVSKLIFAAIGDFGNPTPAVLKTAKAMGQWAEKASPSFILALGDNFYPSGVQSVDDEGFEEKWQNVFLTYPSLKVPWRAVLGNHDYDGNVQAQIDFTTHRSNPQGLWQLPAKTHSFSVCLSGTPTSASLRASPSNYMSEDSGGNCSVDFFALDTNECQNSVVKRNPAITGELKKHMAELSDSLKRSTATWKIVFAHHPMYTKGVHHGLIGRCLRDKTYEDAQGNIRNGFALEELLVSRRVDAYITGHEHRFQHHCAHGVRHFIAGAAGCDNQLYGGADPRFNIDWVDQSESDGFMVVEITATEMIVKFISNDGACIRQVEIRK